jgi:hypothetical protein
MSRKSPFRSLQTQQPQHIAEILPDVLARYGLDPAGQGQPASHHAAETEFSRALAPLDLRLTELALPLSLS